MRRIRWIHNKRRDSVPVLFAHMDDEHGLKKISGRSFGAVALKIRRIILIDSFFIPLRQRVTPANPTKARAVFVLLFRHFLLLFAREIPKKHIVRRRGVALITAGLRSRTVGFLAESPKKIRVVFSVHVLWHELQPNHEATVNDPATCIIRVVQHSHFFMKHTHETGNSERESSNEIQNIPKIRAATVIKCFNLVHNNFCKRGKCLADAHATTLLKFTSSL